MSKLRLALAAAILPVLIYLADGLVLHFRREPFGSIVVSRYDAIPQKNGKIEFVFEQPTTQPCVHALFPHSGDQTCWYLSRHTEQRINY
jgi:hypothetical protein